jgi:hypothetical protein
VEHDRSDDDLPRQRAATDYQRSPQTLHPLAAGSMTITHYVYPEQRGGAQTSFPALPAMITFFAQKFGEYPFVEDKYGMSEFSWGGAMEHATNTSYGTQLVNGIHNVRLHRRARAGPPVVG